MAFKLPFIAECDGCKEEIRVYAVSKEDANKKYEAMGWYANKENHACPDCRRG